MGALLLAAPVAAPRPSGIDLGGRAGAGAVPLGTPSSDLTPMIARPGGPSRGSPEATLPAPGAGDAPSGGEVPERPQAPELDGPPPLDTLEGYVWPIAKPRLTLPFGQTPWGSRLVDGRPFHDGIDLATFCGDRVVAAHAGRVLAAGRRYDDVMGWVGDLGPYLDRLERKGLWQTLPIVVVIDDGNGYRSVYAHFSRIVVRTGDEVRAGQLLGREGATGRASGCHLHYGLFSPLERSTFGIRPDVVKRMKVPRQQIARVDPLLVLPPKPGINAPATPRPAPPDPAPSPGAR